MKVFRKAVLFLIFTGLFAGSVHAIERFGFKVGKEDVFLWTKGNVYLAQPSSIVCSGNMMYFAAQDFTSKDQLIVKGLKKAEVQINEPDRKLIKATYSLEDQQKKVSPDYELVIFLEIRKEFPFLVVYSKFKYLGKGEHKCGINWGVDASQAGFFKYYTYPKNGNVVTYPLVKTKRSKIGQANWIFVNDGKGEGVGIIAPAVLLGRGSDFVFINSVPRTEKLEKGESLDTFIIFMPINKNYKILQELFDKIKNMKWDYAE